ncbi:MAG: CRISPR-associated endonuclease Cas2 [Thermodesulfobacteriota bacterium]
MRAAYLVSYDITDPKRWRKVYKTLHGFGDPVQYSVFICELSEADKVRMAAKLDGLIHHDDDQVLIVDLGPSPGRADQCVKALGRPYQPRERRPIVV